MFNLRFFRYRPLPYLIKIPNITLHNIDNPVIWWLAKPDNTAN